MGKRPRRFTVERERRPLIGLAIAVLAVLVALGIVVLLEKPPRCTRFTSELIGQKVFEAPPCTVIDTRDARYIATLETSEGTIRMILDPILAPADVNNLVFLARVGFYDGLTFHHVENTSDHALVQTGDPTGTGRGNAGYTYHGTDPSPIVQYKRGVVAMGNLGTPATNGSQFFIVVRDYAAIGSPKEIPRYSFVGVIADEASLDTLDRTVAGPLDGTRPRRPVRIEHMTIEEQPRSS